MFHVFHKRISELFSLRPKSLRQRSGRLNKNQRGVTLIELMSTVVIIGVVAAMAGPRFSHEVEKMKFRGSARAIVSKLREARSLAISEKALYGVVFNSSKATFTLFKDNISSVPPGFQTGDSTLTVDTLPGEHASISSTFGAVLFRANGSATQSGSITPVSYGSEAGSATNYATISILSSTGRVRLDDMQNY